MPLLLSIIFADANGGGAAVADTLVAWLTPIYQQQMRKRARLCSFLLPLLLLLLLLPVPKLVMSDAFYIA